MLIRGAAAIMTGVRGAAARAQERSYDAAAR
jgi:hypothetical protein